MHITNLSGKMFIIQTLVFFTTSAKVSSSLKLHLFAVYGFFQLMLFEKSSILLINQITYLSKSTSITFTLHKNGFSIVVRNGKIVWKYGQ